MNGARHTGPVQPIDNGAHHRIEVCGIEEEEKAPVNSLPGKAAPGMTHESNAAAAAAAAAHKSFQRNPQAIE